MPEPTCTCDPCECAGVATVAHGCGCPAAATDPIPHPPGKDA